MIEMFYRTLHSQNLPCIRSTEEKAFCALLQKQNEKEIWKKEENKLATYGAKVLILNSPAFLMSSR